MSSYRNDVSAVSSDRNDVSAVSSDRNDVSVVSSDRNEVSVHYKHEVQIVRKRKSQISAKNMNAPTGT